MTHPNPIEIVAAFGRCIHARDAASAERFCTELGWTSRGNSGRRIYRQLSREDVRLVPQDFDYQHAERAMVPASIIRNDDQSIHGSIALFLVQTDRGWRIEGISKSHKLSALFLAGEIPAICSFTDLPESTDGLAWAEEKLAQINTQTIYTEDDVHHVWNVPCFGAIPYQVPGDVVSKELTDAIQQVGITIDRLAPNTPKLIAVTSCATGAGCSMVSGAVATSFAALGDRTLLVDLHPTTPKLHTRFQVADLHPGLAQLASGKADFPECLKPTQHANIRFLSAGNHQAVSRAMLNCLAELLPIFDRVVINAPQQSEIASFIQERDGVLALVVALGRSTIDELSHAITPLTAFTPPQIGYILNFVPAGHLDEANERLREAKRTKGHLEIIGARYFEAVDRVAVGIRSQLANEKYGRDQWRVLTRQRETGAFVERYVSPVPMMDLLLNGLDVDFSEGKLTINELSTGLPFVRLAESDGSTGHESMDVIDLDRIRDAAKSIPTSSPASDFESNLKDLLEGYVENNLGSMDSSEFLHRATIDPKFVETHAPAFLGALFTEMTRSLIPKEIKLSTTPSTAKSTPVSHDSADTPHEEPSTNEINIKVDFRDIFNTLFNANTRKGTTDKE